MSLKESICKLIFGTSAHVVHGDRELGGSSRSRLARERVLRTPANGRSTVGVQGIQRLERFP